MPPLNRRGIITGKISLVPYFLGVPPIPTPPNCFNVIVQRMCCKLSPYFPNMFHDRVAIPVPIQSPHKFINSFSVKDLACIEGKKLHNFKLPLGQRNALAIDCSCPGRVISCQFTKEANRRITLAALLPSQVCGNTCP